MSEALIDHEYIRPSVRPPRSSWPSWPSWPSWLVAWRTQTASEPAHGYSLLGRLNEFGVAEEVDVGQLYRTLRELEMTGLVRSRWETPAAGAARREYEISELGLAALEEWAVVMKERARLVSQFLKEYERPGHGRGSTTSDEGGPR